MILIPFSRKSGEYELFIILLEENIERLKRYDPVSINMKDVRMGAFASGTLMNVYVGYSTAEDLETAKVMSDAGELAEMLAFLTRGWELRPDLGDHDVPGLSLKQEPGERSN